MKLDGAPTLRAGVARTRIQHGAVLAVLLAAIGLLILVAGGRYLAEAELVAGVNLAGAAIVGFNVWRQSRDRRPRLVIDDDGVWHHGWGVPPVPWRLIRGAAVSGSRINAVAAITLTDADVFLEQLAPDARRRLAASRLFKPPNLLIPNATVDVPLERIAAVINARLTAPDQRSHES